MSIIGKLFGVAIDVVKLPVSVVKDVVTLGGATTGEDSATIKNLEELADDLTDL